MVVGVGVPRGLGLGWVLWMDRKRVGSRLGPHHRGGLSWRLTSFFLVGFGGLGVVEAGLSCFADDDACRARAFSPQ